MRLNRTFIAFSSGIGVAIAAVAGINACTSPDVEIPVSPADPRQAFIQEMIDQGETVGTVIVCEMGWTASVDTTPDGFEWAACM